MKFIVCVFGLFLALSCQKESKVVEQKQTDTTIEINSETQQFWDRLNALCGKSFEGQLILPEDDEDFGGKRLVMHVRSCEANRLRIPFFVGDDRSRTWVLTLKEHRIQLKHDHRHEDGTEDEITMYGGTTTNAGQANIQAFSADEETKSMIPAASTNVWWITIDDNQFTYNLRRLGTERVFRVTFDIKNPVEDPEAPWG